MNKQWKTMAAIAAAVTIGAVSAGATNAWAGQGAPAETKKVLGGGNTELKFVPVEPCRVADTREAAEPAPLVHVERGVKVRGTGAAFAAQGGKADGCGIPGTARAAEITITATDVQGDKPGFLRAYPGAEPDATFLNYSKYIFATNTGTVQLSNCDAAICLGGDLAPPDLKYILSGANADVVVEVQGYYLAPIAASVSATGTLIADETSRTVGITKSDAFPGLYTIQFDRDVSKCVATGVINGNASGTVIVTDSGDVDKQDIQVTAQNGDLADLPFAVTMNC